MRVYYLLDLALYLDVVSIFIYTWTLLDMGIADQDTNCKKAMTLYKNISIFIFPLISYAFYIADSLSYASYYYDVEIGAKTSIKKADFV